MPNISRLLYREFVFTIMSKLWRVTMTVKWQDLHFGKLHKVDILPTSKFISSAAWQAFRLTLKGKETSVKLEMLHEWLEDHGYDQASKIQVTNYINSLKRAGQVK